MNEFDLVAELSAARVLVILRPRGRGRKWMIDTAAHLLDRGLRMIELTMGDPEVPGALAELVERYPEVTFGVGTVLTPDEARLAAGVGAKFIVAPNVNPVVMDAAHIAGLATLPGVMTPTEVELALSHGASAVKLFPAGPLGPQYMKALLDPFPDLKVVPTGGVGLAEIRTFLDAGAVAVAIGGAITNQDLEQAGAVLAEALADVLPSS